jgi:predicted metal-dependent phosphotriesterase family hydrolase
LSEKSGVRILTNTGIRPGFIKVGVDSGPLSGIDLKLVQAAARAHLASALTIAVQTGNNPASAREHQMNPKNAPT